MKDLKVVLLKASYPAGNPALWVPKPLQGCMIGSDDDDIDGHISKDESA